MKFKEGEFVELVDQKGRKYLFKLKKGGRFHSHLGVVFHDKIIGKEPGFEILSSQKKKFLVFPFTTFSYVLKMRRGAQIIYPKDIGAILVFGDIGQNQKILEAGTGSGALSIYLLKVLGEKGKLISYEKRKDFLENAKRNIKEYFGGLPKNLILRQRDIYREGIKKEDGNLDRVIFDLPEPWRAFKTVKENLLPGGILVCYNPTVQQMLKNKEELEKVGGFYIEEMFEILKRDWKIEKESMRPKDRMVAHTAFIFIARRIRE